MCLSKGVYGEQVLTALCNHALLQACLATHCTALLILLAHLMYRLALPDKASLATLTSKHNLSITTQSKRHAINSTVQASNLAGKVFWACTLTHVSLKLTNRQNLLEVYSTAVATWHSPRRPDVFACPST